MFAIMYFINAHIVNIFCTVSLYCIVSDNGNISIQLLTYIDTLGTKYIEITLYGYIIVIVYF